MDEESFKKLFLPLHFRLYRIAYALTENSQDAEDILQEAYCKLWDKRNELSSIASPEAYCITLVKNLCLDFLRSAYKTKKEDIPEKFTLIQSETPEKEFIRLEEINQVVEQLMKNLPENQRKVIRLRAIE